MKPIILLLKGGAATGKSSAFSNLKKEKVMNGWFFLDHPELKSWFEKMSNIKELRKEVLFFSMKPLIKMEKNIILEEMSRETLNKYLGYYLKKYNYQIFTINFEVNDVKKSIRRDKLRVQRGTKHHLDILNKKYIEENHEHHLKTIDKYGIIINSSTMNQRAVVETILKHIKIINRFNL